MKGRRALGILLGLLLPVPLVLVLVLTTNGKASSGDSPDQGVSPVLSFEERQQRVTYERSCERREDVCGLKLEHVHIAWTGGYSYFHRNVPLYPHFGPGRDSGHFNYVITHVSMSGGGEVVAEEAGHVLVRLPWPGCVADPGYSWRLP